MSEIFDVVDEDDNVIGEAPRKECHTNNKLIHRAVHIFVFNSKGELLLEKRTMNRDLYPGRWIDVAGHLNLGEMYEDAAKRELKEEIGIKAELKHICDIKKRIEQESENIRLFTCKHNGPFKINKDEMELVKFFTIDWIKKEVKNNPDSFTPGTVFCLKKFLEITK
jgi:16S rRNA (adenine1518-N6/adenine1519-N6)-dimethyltransferase